MSPAQLMLVMFPGAKYLWLKHRDKVRQAVSLYVRVANEYVVVD
jgi:LPS sulfotransferase NodH